MQKIRGIGAFSWLWVAVIVFVSIFADKPQDLLKIEPPPTNSIDKPIDILDTMPLKPDHGLVADPETNVMFVPPRYSPSRAPRTATMQVNWNPSTCPTDVVPWPTDAQNAFNYAIGIWESILVSAVPIEIDACWRPLGSNYLGSAGPTNLTHNFSGAPLQDTLYPIAIANDLAGVDVNGDRAEITASFSSQFPDWYFGTDGAPGFRQYDFATVVIHEIAHGLGFSGSMVVSSGLGRYGLSNIPTVYDRFAKNGDGDLLVGGFANGSAALAAELTSGSVYFDAPKARNANGGNAVELYAPASWTSGGSFSHLDDTFDNSSDALMTHSIKNGEAIHDPGDVALGVLASMGWETNTNTGPITVVAQIYLPFVVRN